MLKLNENVSIETIYFISVMLIPKKKLKTQRVRSFRKKTKCNLKIHVRKKHFVLPDLTRLIAVFDTSFYFRKSF